MSDGSDWQDPLAEPDEAARDRERRRAEREARRRERQGSIGERVREEMAEERTAGSADARASALRRQDAPPPARPPQPTEAQPARQPPPGPPSAAVNRRRFGALLGLAALAFVALRAWSSRRSALAETTPRRPSRRSRRRPSR